MISYSVIVPVLNEEANITPFYNELTETMRAGFELIWVDDGSRDKTLEIIRAIASKDQRVKCISFSRNFGHQAALMAGLFYASGERIVFMDGDLQHPPSFLPQLFSKLDEGFDLVSAKKMETEKIGWMKKSTSSWFYKLINFLSDTPIDENVSDFRVFNRKVRDAILQFQEKELFLRGIFNWIGFKSITLPFTAPARLHGNTKYPLTKMIQLGLKGALSFSFKPLRISLIIGAFFSFVAFALIIFALISYFKGNTIPGWASIFIGVMFMGGIQLMMIGLIGEYISSFFIEVKKRPLFLVDDKINID